ncbi:hypothetical protein [Desulfovibrio sp. JC010]|uniref:hypothetical protein n=1 Tax=Desulfovibrio sp. JC010 TaxID=2593641 RepID=UPI0013D2DF21|nr:hypothetical protein [Desulfovibrio sp. JC010]NDV26898.1 hypothetical protein [Desulfovibrio sp. JC010]
MAKTGLLIKLSIKLSDDWKSYQQKENTPEALAFQNGLKDTLDMFKELAEAKDPKAILEAEQIALIQEKEFANSAEMVNSIKPGLTQLQEARQSLELVHDSETYQKVTAAFSGKRKQGGLPMDGFREFIKSHQARLTNRLKSDGSHEEKNILRQRKTNLKIANETYIKLQKKALGIGNAKGKGIAR